MHACYSCMPFAKPLQRRAPQIFSFIFIDFSYFFIPLTFLFPLFLLCSAREKAVIIALHSGYIIHTIVLQYNLCLTSEVEVQYVCPGMDPTVSAVLRLSICLSIYLSLYFSIDTCPMVCFLRQNWGSSPGSDRNIGMAVELFRENIFVR